MPDGPKGDMCRSVQDDVDFGRFFLMGANPTWIERCSRIPDNFAVTESDVEGYLNSEEKTLAEAAEVRLWLHGNTFPLFREFIVLLSDHLAIERSSNGILV